MCVCSASLAYPTARARPRADDRPPSHPARLAALGRILRLPLTAVGQSVFALDAASEPILDGRVTALAHAFDPPTGRFYLGAGDDDGGFAVLDPAFVHLPSLRVGSSWPVC